MHNALKGAAVAAFLIGASSDALACPDGWSSNSFNFCQPNIELPKVDLSKVVDPLPSDAKAIAVSAATGWVQVSAETARGTAVELPADVKRALSPWFDQSTLDNARFKIGDNGLLNAARTIFHLSGATTAVTLKDTIVFRDEAGAQDLALIAHELVHIQQFSEWGVEGFVQRYIEDTASVEDPAYAKEREVRSSLSAQQAPATQPTKS